MTGLVKVHLNRKIVDVKLHFFFTFFSLKLEKNFCGKKFRPNGRVKMLKNS